jgi:hypothetical protein
VSQQKLNKCNIFQYKKLIVVKRENDLRKSSESKIKKVLLYTHRKYIFSFVLNKVNEICLAWKNFYDACNLEGEKTTPVGTQLRENKISTRQFNKILNECKYYQLLSRTRSHQEEKCHLLYSHTA